MTTKNSTAKTVATDGATDAVITSPAELSEAIGIPSNKLYMKKFPDGVHFFEGNEEPALAHGAELVLRIPAGDTRYVLTIRTAGSTYLHRASGMRRERKEDSWQLKPLLTVTAAQMRQSAAFA